LLGEENAHVLRALMDFKDKLVTCSSSAAPGSGVAQNNLDDASARRL
jgi:hypothetical protein